MLWKFKVLDIQKTTQKHSEEGKDARMRYATEPVMSSGMSIRKHDLPQRVTKAKPASKSMLVGSKTSKQYTTTAFCIS